MNIEVKLNGRECIRGVDYTVKANSVMTFHGPLCGPLWLRRALRWMKPRLKRTDTVTVVYGGGGDD